MTETEKLRHRESHVPRLHLTVCRRNRDCQSHPLLGGLSAKLCNRHSAVQAGLTSVGCFRAHQMLTNAYEKIPTWKWRKPGLESPWQPHTRSHSQLAETSPESHSAPPPPRPNSGGALRAWRGHAHPLECGGEACAQPLTPAGGGGAVPAPHQCLHSDSLLGPRGSTALCCGQTLPAACPASSSPPPHLLTETRLLLFLTLQLPLAWGSPFHPTPTLCPNRVPPACHSESSSTT